MPKSTATHPARSSTDTLTVSTVACAGTRGYAPPAAKASANVRWQHSTPAAVPARSCAENRSLIPWHDALHPQENPAVRPDVGEVGHGEKQRTNAEQSSHQQIAKSGVCPAFSHGVFQTEQQSYGDTPQQGRQPEAIPQTDAAPCQRNCNGAQQRIPAGKMPSTYWENHWITVRFHCAENSRTDG